MTQDNAVTFRVAQPTDALCVGVLATQVFLDTYAPNGLNPILAREALTQYSTAIFDARIRDLSSHVILAERAGYLIAFAECSTRTSPPLLALKGTMELTRLYVQPPWKRIGIGAALLTRAEAHARSSGSPLLWLTAWSGNANARAFYGMQGYQDVGATSYAFEDQAYENRIYSKVLDNAP